MIMRVYEQAKKVQAFSEVIVATDDARIFDHVHTNGGNAIMTLSTHASGTDRCGEIVNAAGHKSDVVINIQGDEPFIQPMQLELLISAFNDEETEIATLAKRIESDEEIDDPNIVKTVFTDSGNALYFSRSRIPYLRDKTQKNEAVYYKHIGLYGYRTTILKEIIRFPQTALEKTEMLEQLRWLENDYPVTVLETDIDSVSVDTPEDLEKIISRS